MERLEGSLRKVLRSAGVPDAGMLAEVTQAWPAAVGDPIARAAWPHRIARDGTLLVATSSATWAFELGLLGEEILAKLAAAVGPNPPRAIRFSPGPIPEPAAAAASAPATQPAQPTAPTRLLAEELTAGMSDEELRATIARAAAASLARERSDHHF